MIPIRVRIVERPPSAEKIAKNINFGIATGLTQTAKEGQEAVQGSVKGSFTYRNRWLPQSNKFGIRTKPAKPNNLTAVIHTQAGWLVKQKVGKPVRAGDRNRRVFPYTFGGEEYIARPSRALRPKGSTKVLTKRLWPENLKKRFVIRTKKGQRLLLTRFAEGKSGTEVMYILDKVINVKPVDAFYGPIRKVVKRLLDANIRAGVQKAFATMR